MESNAQTIGSRRRDQNKRRRVEKACETCRRRKERCNGSKPKCSNCEAASRDCEYSSESKKRGLPEGWVRGLEKLWALAIIRSPGIDGDIISIIRESLSNPLDGALAAFWTDETDDKGFFKQWKASKLCQELEKLLPILERLPKTSINGISPQATPFLRRGSLPDDSFDTERRLPTHSDVGVPELEINGPHFFQPVPPKSLQNNQPNSPESSRLITLPAYALTLIDNYFRSTHVWFPILEKHKVYRAYHQWYEPSSAADSGDRACVLAIITYQRMQHEDPSDLGVVATAGGIGSKFGGFSSSVRDLIPTEYRKHKLSHIQAILVLSLAYIGAGLCDDAWLLVGQTSRLALLERTIDGNRLSNTNESRLYHVLAGCFVLDNLLLAVSALPSQLRDQDPPGLGQLDEDGIEEWTPAAEVFGVGRDISGPVYSISTFNRLVQVTGFLSRVTRKSPHAIHFIHQLELVEAEMLSWDNVQASRNRLDQVLDPNLHDPVPSHQLTVHLIHLAALIVIGARYTGLREDANSQLSYRLGQLVDLVQLRILNLDSDAILPIWEPVLSLVMSETEKVERLFNVVVPLDLCQTLEKFVTLAKSRWAVFNSLYIRVQAHLQAPRLVQDGLLHRSEESLAPLN